MSKYHRAKRQDFNKSPEKQMEIILGHRTDSIVTLKQLCNDKSLELLCSLEMDEGEQIKVLFCTDDNMPSELIGISTFYKTNENITFTFSLDETTL